MVRFPRLGLTCVCVAAALWNAAASAQTIYYEEAPRHRGWLHKFGWFGKRSECCPPATPYYETQPTPHAVKPTEPAERPRRPEAAPEQPDRPAEPTEPAAPEATPFDSTDFASAFETAGGPSGLAPSMLGDFIGVIYRQPVEPVEGVIDTQQKEARARILNRYKVADNTSPIPQTRLLYSYNYFSDAFGTAGDIHRNTFGAELAMFDDLFSIEIRQAIDSFRRFPGESNRSSFANLRTILKAVLYRQRDFILTGGLGMGFPTGDRVAGTPSNNYLFTPFVGYLVRPQESRWFLQGFQQLDVPTSGDDQMLVHTDVGVGYWLHENGDGPTILPGVTAIAPTMELHLYTPIGDDPSGRLLGLVYRDVLNLTLGSAFFFGPSASMSLGVGLPISTQKDYDYELQAHFQYRFGAAGRPPVVPFSG